MKADYLDKHPPRSRAQTATTSAPKAGLCTTCARECKQPDLVETLRCPRFMRQGRTELPPRAPQKGA